MPDIDLQQFMLEQQSLLAEAEAIADPTERREAVAYRAADEQGVGDSVRGRNDLTGGKHGNEG